jgi:WD40 repeat protein
MLWDFASGELLSQHDDLHAPAALSGDGKTAVAVIRGEAPGLRVWKVETGMARWILGGFLVEISELTIDRNGSLLAVTDRDGIRVYDLTERKLKWKDEKVYPFLRPAFSGDGQRLAFRHWDQYTEVWDTRGDRDIVEASWDFLGGGVPLIGDLVNCLAMDEKGRRLFTGTARLFKPDGESEAIGVWDTKYRVSVVGNLEGHQAGVTSIAIDAAGRTLVSGGAQGVIKVWSLGARAFDTYHCRYDNWFIDEVDQLPEGGLALIFGQAHYGGWQLRLFGVEKGKPLRSWEIRDVPQGQGERKRETVLELPSNKASRAAG